MAYHVYYDACTFHVDMSEVAMGRSKGRQVVKPQNVTMYPRQWATVQSYAKDQGGWCSKRDRMRATQCKG